MVRVKEHLKAPCNGLFETPIDHYHLLVWYSNCAKPTDINFHRRFYQFENNVDWNSAVVRSERGMIQYCLCEPRVMIELYCSKQKYQFVKECYETRHEQQAKIEEREKKLAAAKEANKQSKVNPKIVLVDDDWWLEREYKPMAIVNFCTKHAIRDVSTFLNYMLNFIQRKAWEASYSTAKSHERESKSVNTC